MPILAPSIYYHSWTITRSTSQQQSGNELELKEDFNLALFPLSVEAYANPHCSRSRDSPLEGLARAEFRREDDRQVLLE
jgi:hypothetical protein